MISSIPTLVQRTPCQRLPRLPQVSLVRCLGVLAVLLLTSCSSASTPAPPATPISHATPTSPTTPATTGGPTPLVAPLAPPPQNCTLTPPPHEQSFADGGSLLGGGVFWIRAGYFAVLHLGPTGYHEWAQWKWVVEVGPNAAQLVTLHLWNLQTGAFAWWSATPPSPATQTLVLDPQLDTQDVGPVSWLAAIPHGESAPGWKEWGIFPLFSIAGCYALEASWAGGSWQSILAVGN